MQRESEIESAARSSPAGGADSQPALLQAEGLSKTYPHAPAPALLEFSLSIAPGEIVGLLGPNGAGKTTAISLLTGLLAPDSGRIRIGGVDFVKSPRRVRGWIGLVPQHIALYPSLTAAENLAYFGRMYGLAGPELRERVEGCLKMVGLTANAHGRIAAFSGGMKRRANLAAALLHRPRLLFLDEPTAGVDPQSRHLVLEQLSDLRRSGTAMLYTTHYIEEAERICSRVAIIDRGRVIALGTPRQLLDAHPDCADLGAIFLRLTGRELRD